MDGQGFQLTGLQCLAFTRSCKTVINRSHTALMVRMQIRSATLKSNWEDFPGGPGLRICLPMPETCIRSLIWELRSHIL